MVVSYSVVGELSLFVFFFVFQAEDGIRDLVRSRGLGDVYKRQEPESPTLVEPDALHPLVEKLLARSRSEDIYGTRFEVCLLYTSDAADERSSVDLGGRRLIKKKQHTHFRDSPVTPPTKIHTNN